MYADTQEERPGLEEMYQGAVATSSLKLEEHRRTAADMIAAAGMNRHRMGLALLRLRSEWASSSRPAPPTVAQIEALAASYPIEPSKDRDGLANPNAGKVRVTRDGKDHYRLPLRQAKTEADDWYAHELGLLMLNLKSLPWVRLALLARSRMGGWAQDEHLVARVLLWWLHPKCQECGGAKERVIPDSGGRTSGRLCKPCRGTGEADPPASRNGGDRIAGYIRGCIAAAKRELTQGVYRHDRTLKGMDERKEAVKTEGAIEFNSWAYRIQMAVHAAAERETDYAKQPAAVLRRIATVKVPPDVEWAVTELRGESPVFWIVGAVMVDFQPLKVTGPCAVCMGLRERLAVFGHECNSAN